MVQPRVDHPWLFCRLLTCLTLCEPYGTIRTMHTIKSLIADLYAMRLKRDGTIFVHTSFKSLGEVEGGPKTLIDALVEYMEPGLLVFPAHTWETTPKTRYFSVKDSPGCVGIIPEYARKHSKAHRSVHPTHSVVAIGKDAQSFTTDPIIYDTPCNRNSSYGKLLDRNATIVLIGVDLNRDTFLHCIEEWLNVPVRIKEETIDISIELVYGTDMILPYHTHAGPIAAHYLWVKQMLIDKDMLHEGSLGDAKVLYHSTQEVYSLLKPLLKAYPTFFT